MDPKDIEKFGKSLDKIEKGIDDNNGKIVALETAAKAEKEAREKAEKEFKEYREKRDKEFDDFCRKFHAKRSRSTTVRKPGQVSDDCAELVGAMFIMGCAAKGQVSGGLVDKCKGIVDGISQKTALTTTDVPLPVEYFSEVRELISEFGVVRSRMMRFPIGRGTAKPPRFKTRPTFGSIAMSAAFPEKSPQIDFASLESHKIGGIVRVPREIDEQSIVAMGQFLMRYGAIEFARAEDTWGFLADGTATYELVKGVLQIARDNNKFRQLGAAKTSPSDTTKNDIRQLRTKVNKAALSAARSAYYFDSTWEAKLGDFNTQAEPNFYRRNPDGSAVLDGYPVVWTDVLQVYTEDPAANQATMIFGAMDFWWMGEHGSPRMDFSSDVYFTTDELGTRFIEEIDFDYQQVDVTAALLTAAA